MKTLEAWFNKLPEPQRSQAKTNTIKHHGRSPQELEDKDLPNALLGGFVFDATPEGSDYWWEIYNKYLV